MYVMWQIFYSVCHMAHTGTIYMTVVVTVERAMVVMRPLKAKYICTRRRAVLVSSAVLLWAIVYNVPRILEFKAHREEPMVSTYVFLSKYICTRPNGVLVFSVALLLAILYNILCYIEYKAHRKDYI